MRCAYIRNGDVQINNGTTGTMIVSPLPEISPLFPLPVLGVSLAALGPRSYALRARSRLPSPPARAPSPP
jgi:hypothetical protein